MLPEPNRNSPGTLIFYCCVFAVLSLGTYLANFWMNRSYLSGYIDKEDDIAGDTDLNKRLILERKEAIRLDSLLYTFNHILLPISMIMLNYSLMSTVAKLFFISYDDNSQAKAEKYVLLTSNMGECAGSALAIVVQFVKVKWLFVLLGCRIILWLIMAIDTTANQSKISSVSFVWFIFFFTFTFLSGFVSTQLSSAAVSMVQEKHRKTVGFILFVSIIFGVSYGDFATIISFSKVNPN